MKPIKKGSLRVWWIPQIPGKAFYVNVENLDEGKKLMEVLANYDIFQYEEHVKPDYSNAGGIQRFDGKEWEDVDEED